MSTSITKTKSNKRYGILAMIFITVVINYLDRTNISVAAFALRTDLGIDTEQMGWVFSIFGIFYTALQIPGGILADRIKSRILYPIILILWSVATLVQGFINSLVVLLGLRASIGVFEAPSYPINNLVVSRWFPENERASAIAVYTSGQYLGLAFLMPVLTLVQNAIGWRGLFIVSGIIGVLWAIIWYFFYRDPRAHRSVSESELEYIEQGGGLVGSKTKDEEKKKFTWNDLKQAFIYQKLWGIYIGQFCLGAITWFFLTWFPTYLVEFRGLDFVKSGYYASVPYLAAFVGILLSGFTSDYLTKKGFSAEISRKAPIITGMLLTVFIVGANFTDDTFFVILFLGIAGFGMGLASIAWVFVSLIAPKENLGLVGGAFNCIAGLSAFVPAIIGYLVSDGDFNPALVFIAIVSLIGVLSYIFIVGKVERIIPKN
ncbi:MFS transporter [Flavobacteriaceae bacterium MHTCC 0001]